MRQRIVVHQKTSLVERRTNYWRWLERRVPRSTKELGYDMEKHLPRANPDFISDLSFEQVEGHPRTQPDKEYSRYEKIQALRDSLTCLTPKQLEVATCIMYQGSEADLARRWNCTHENVTQVKQAMIEKLKTRLNYLYE